MSATIIDGKAFAARLRQQVAAEVADLKARGLQPGLAVVLVFWGSWCHACHGTLAAIQADIAKLPPDKKTVLLAVNTDPLDTLKGIIATEHIECRQWSDLFNRGPISAVWNIHSWPCIFIIDSKGVIRRKNVPRTDVDHALREVLAMP